MQQTLTPDDSPSSSSTFQNPDYHLNHTQQQLLQRIMELSFQQSLKKPEKMHGLSMEYRKMITNLKMKKSRQTCTICLSGYVEGQTIKKLPCKHIFHRECGKQWFKVNKRCPICRLDIQEYFSKNKGCRQEEKTDKEIRKEQKEQKKEIKIIKQIKLCT